MRPRFTPLFQPVGARCHRGKSLAAGRESAFTLLEVLVASAVLSVVMAILLSTLTTSLSLWRTTEASIAAGREGRAAKLLLAQDLANALVPTNPALWPQVTTNSLRFLTLRPPDYQSSSADLGDVCFVEYKVQDDADNANPNFVALTRSFVGSADTFTAIKNGAFPASGRSELLAANIVPNERAVYINSGAVSEVSDAPFTALGTDSLPLPAGSSQPPALIDVNISAADDSSIETLDIAAKQLRSAGYFPFRVALPRPQ
jgi:prepilin-type N-terminal cleavage/methylation domain-containing protein